MLLEIQDLRKDFTSPDGEISTIVDVSSFSLAEGEMVGLQGSSGSGKTTFLNLIAGVLKPTSGQVKLNGTDIAQLREGQRDRLRASTIGYIFQTFNLLHGYTALENVTLAMSLAGKVDLAFAHQLLLEVGLDKRMQYRPAQLSTGQQQRVAVARAMANRPRLVLADEPTGNLDPRRAGEALALMQSLCAENQAALLLVSHDTDVLAQMPRVVKLADLTHGPR